MDNRQKWSLGVFVVLRGNNDHFWLVKHNYGQKKWSLPGGGLELGEKIDQGICREAKEETGFEIKVLNPPIGIFSLIKSLGVAVLFQGYIINDSNKPNPNEISECRLFSTYEIYSMVERDEIYPAQFGLIKHAIEVKRENWPVYDWLIKPT